MTGKDMISVMSIDELADLLCNRRACYMCAYKENACENVECIEGIRTWLETDETMWPRTKKQGENYE